MSRETLEAVEQAPGSALATPEGPGEDRPSVSARLARLERAYAELLQRVRGYERERLEIRTRLERLLARLPRY